MVTYPVLTLTTILIFSAGQAFAEGTPAMPMSSLTFSGDPNKSSASAVVFETTPSAKETASPQTPSFTMKQNVTTSENEIRVQRIYSDGSGISALQEIAVYKNLLLTRIELHQKQLGEVGIARIENGKVFYEYTKSGNSASSEESLEENFVPSDQIYPYLVSHWTELMNKKDVAIRFPVLQRTESVGFRFRWNRQIEHEGQKLDVIRMEPSSLFIRLLVPHIEFFFVSDANGIQLKEIAGRTALNAKDGDAWKPFIGRVLFTPK